MYSLVCVWGVLGGGRRTVLVEGDRMGVNFFHNVEVEAGWLERLEKQRIRGTAFGGESRRTLSNPQREAGGRLP